MSSEKDEVARCQALRSKLRSLHYFQPLNIESCSLVEKLLDDVLKSVDNFEVLAKRYDKNAKKLQENENLIEALKQDKLKLVEENTRLQSVIRNSENKCIELESNYNATAKRLEDSERQWQQSALPSPYSLQAPLELHTIESSKGEVRDSDLKTGQQLSVLSLELQLKQQEVEKNNEQLEFYQREIQMLKDEKAKEIGEASKKLEILKNDIRKINTDRNSLMQKVNDLQKQLGDKENQRSDKQPEKLSQLNSKKHCSTTRQCSALPEAEFCNENQFQLDNERKIALLEEKVAQLEKNLRIERSRTHKHLKEKEKLMGELEEKIQAVERFQALQELQRRKNRHLSPISKTPPKADKSKVCKDKANGQLAPFRGDSNETSNLAVAYNKQDQPETPPKSQPLILQDSDTASCPHRQNDDSMHCTSSCSTSQAIFQSSELPPLLSHYFSTISPINKMNSVISTSPIKRLSLSMPVISAVSEVKQSPVRHNSLNKLDQFQEQLEEWNADFNDHDARADRRKLHQQLRFVENSLQAVLESRTELQRNAELREQFIRSQQITFNRKIGNLTTDLKGTKLKLEDAIKEKEHIERELESKEDTIMILEGRIDLLARRVSELSSAAEESKRETSTDLKETVEAANRQQAEIRSLRAVNTALASKLTSAEAACRRLFNSTKDLREKAESATREIDSLKAEAIRTQIYLDQKETEQAELQAGFVALEKEFEVMKEQAEKTTQFESEVLRLQCEVENGKRQCNKLQQKLVDSQKKKIEAEKNFEALRQEALDISKAMESSAEAVAEQQRDKIRTLKENEILIKEQEQGQKRFVQLEGELSRSQQECELLKSKMKQMEIRLTQYRKTFRVQQEIAEAMKKKPQESSLSDISQSPLIDLTPRSIGSSSDTRGQMSERQGILQSFKEFPFDNPSEKNLSIELSGLPSEKGLVDSMMLNMFSNSFREFEKKKTSSSEIENETESDQVPKVGENGEFQTPKPLQTRPM